MKKGEKRILILKPELAFGTGGYYAREVQGQKRFVIPPNTTLVFEIEVLDIVQSVAGKSATIVYRDTQKGDVRHTLADTSKAKRYLRYMPEVDLKTGLQEEWKWFKDLKKTG